ncbi:uncharacterized protein MONOS_8618 [Monocercomonoides exilis]|uniref:uncharacterized protein n=1 Tax=Monocercomonoides exilis TaxID=2049356 RepID=UPI00355A7FDB|nr:hypothetical protein MONOS_8618 [Monocercomonoides exilis]|eukprot:MONOS_8618.1-p1 / transcript=MONOS_8618.1 / gene=MONOS_8618 / organism=Monocercomonoides_exilis_PA203 / gene_product=unspecified product / transcript_product=unspecified product / location=Mono_scaffold00329:27414-28184(-) / protein_length=217 / sequence_SO=supercontig / SO=protein_coding / is_pseudo=false
MLAFLSINVFTFWIEVIKLVIISDELVSWGLYYFIVTVFSLILKIIATFFGFYHRRVFMNENGVSSDLPASFFTSSSNGSYGSIGSMTPSTMSSSYQGAPQGYVDSSAMPSSAGISAATYSAAKNDGYLEPNPVAVPNAGDVHQPSETFNVSGMKAEGAAPIEQPQAAAESTAEGAYQTTNYYSSPDQVAQNDNYQQSSNVVSEENALSRDYLDDL